MFNSENIHQAQSANQNLFAAQAAAQKQNHENWKKHKKHCRLVLIISLAALLVCLIAAIIINIITDNSDGTSESTTTTISAYDDALAQATEIATTSNYPDEAVLSYFNERIEQLLANNDFESAKDVIIARSKYFYDLSDFAQASDLLRDVDLTVFDQTQKSIIATFGLTVSTAAEDDDTYNYWSTIYNSNAQESGYGG